MDWKELLEAAVNERWATRQAFLMQQVKPYLSAAGIDVRGLLAGRHLRPFLETEAPSFRQIQHEEQPTNWGLVPSAAEIERPYSQYFSFKAKAPAVEEFPYQNALRLAFSKPIESELRRWVLAPPARFVDLPAGTVSPEGVEITGDDLVNGNDNDAISNQVYNWLNRHGLNPVDYKPQRSSSTTAPKGRGTALHQLLDLIPDEELRRVSLPLDIVYGLLKR